MQFEHLFTPIKIGPKTIKNRIVSPAHSSRIPFISDQDDPSQYIEYQRARAKGGCGLITIGNLHVHKHSAASAVVGLGTPEVLLTKFRKMADACHEHGGVVVIQLHHRGNSEESDSTLLGNWGFTAVPSEEVGEVCHEMEDEEIEEVLDSYVHYAKIAKEGGLDGVELHAAHGYLLQQSLTNWVNQRTDRWGEQMAFTNELIRRIRTAVGNDFIIGAKIPSDYFDSRGMDNEAMKKVAQALEDTGKLDYLEMSVGSRPSHYSLIMCTMYFTPGAWVPLVSGIKQAVKSIPIIATGRINDPVLAERILAEGHADMVGLCRAQIVDPEFANKAREGRLDDIRLCIGCNQGCIDRIHGKGYKLTCLQNAAVGKEKEIGTIGHAPRKKKVVVIGGGPAGMEAARVAKIRGHDLVLYEKENRLGGQINILSKAPGREEFNQVTRYLTNQLDKLQVNLKLGVEATVETVIEEKPDTVIVATGSTPHFMPVPGSEQDNVFSVSQVLEGATVGQRVVVYDNTSLQEGVTVADFLAEQGKKVEIVTPFPTVGTRIGSTHQPFVWMRLQKKGVVFTTLTELKKISGRTLVVSNVFTGEERTIEGIDSVVMATGYRANDSLYRALKGRVGELFAIGDCYAPLRVINAIHAGYRVARLL